MKDNFDNDLKVKNFIAVKTNDNLYDMGIITEISHDESIEVANVVFQNGTSKKCISSDLAIILVGDLL